MRSVSLFQVVHYQESRGAHGVHGEQARSSMQKAARAQRSKNVGLKGRIPCNLPSAISERGKAQCA